MKKYISPSYVAEKVDTVDVICASGITLSEGTITDNEGNTYQGAIAEVSFSSLFGNN